MDELFTPVSTTYLKSKNDGAAENTTSLNKATAKIRDVGHSDISTVDEALDVLKSQPSYDTLIDTLDFLANRHAAQLSKPSPQSAAIVHVLVSEIVPNYWPLLKESYPSELSSDNASGVRDTQLLLRCLQSVTGLNAILTHMRSLVGESKQRRKDVSSHDISLHIEMFLELTAAILRGHDAIRRLWTTSVAELSDPALKKIQSQTLSSLISSSRVLSTASEVFTLIDAEKLATEARYITDGANYTTWIALNLAEWAKTASSDAEVQTCFDILQRSMSLGYPDTLIRHIVEELLLKPGSSPIQFNKLCFRQSQKSKKIMQILVEYLSKKFLDPLGQLDSSANQSVSAVAGVIRAVVQDDESLIAHLVNWCTASAGAGLGDGIGIRRAVLAVLAEKDAVTTVLEKGLNQFGDQLYIKHTAILQQEVHVQVLLLSAGYVSRLSPIKLTMLVRSGSYLNAISNRIASTQARARLLGMVVGESLSALIDSKGKLDFHVDEMETDDVEWLKSLTGVSDAVGPIDPILSTTPPAEIKVPSAVNQQLPSTKPKQKPRLAKSAPTNLPKAIIEEINSSDDDADDLVPYEKGPDPEDSDDDPTLIQRNKIKPPVYIRDLIAFFRDVESYDKQKMALQTAPVLIRRKANYGTEVSSHAHELAGLLVGLQDKFEFDDFTDMKLQGMIALIVAQPKLMAPWFARTFFEGDYSFTQRTSVLISLGLSCRELAGFDVSAYKAASAFPSKQLPDKIQQLYISAIGDYGQQTLPSPNTSNLKALPPNAIESMAQSLTAEFLAPVAASAADSATGPDVLKLQSFTSRYKSKTKPKPRMRAIPNTTASLIATCFFSSLTAHFQVALRSSRHIILNPALLALYLQTLGIIINAAGPSTLALPQLTSELWDLLLGVRVHVAEDLSALRGWLIALAALLQVNGEHDLRGLCEAQGKEIFETREWVGGVFARVRGEDGGEENDVKMLAAGVLIKLGEAVEKYQSLLMGDMIGYS